VLSRAADGHRDMSSWLIAASWHIESHLASTFAVSPTWEFIAGAVSERAAVACEIRPYSFSETALPTEFYSYLSPHLLESLARRSPSGCVGARMRVGPEDAVGGERDASTEERKLISRRAEEADELFYSVQMEAIPHVFINR